MDLIDPVTQAAYGWPPAARWSALALHRARASMVVVTLVLAAVSIMPPSGAGAQTPDAQKPVKLGVLTSMTGPYADVAGQGMVVAAKMAIEDVGGAVLGKPVELVATDHQSKPDVAVTIARSWFDNEGVDVVLDLASSPVALAVQKLATERKRITMVSTASSDALTNRDCSSYGVSWTFDSYSNGKVAASSAEPGSTWFFITVDNAGGTGLQNAVTPFLLARGAKILGSVRHPLNSADMSSFLLQAQASGAKFIAIANGGADTTTVLKQGREFGLENAGIKLVAVTLFITELKAMGLPVAGGLLFSTAFDSDRDPESAAWAKRFFAIHKAMPTDLQAGLYSAVLHYLKAVRAVGSKDADAVMAKMRETPVDDAFARHGVLRKDGRMVHDMYLAQAKTPAESSGPWDLMKIVRTIPGDQAFRPVLESECPLVKTGG